MAKPSRVPRPTENAAIGRVKPRGLRLPSLYSDLALAVRCHDNAGARLVRHQLVRAMASGTVGER